MKLTPHGEIASGAGRAIAPRLRWRAALRGHTTHRHAIRRADGESASPGIASHAPEDDSREPHDGS